MTDTSPEARKKQLEIILLKTKEERLLMALQMMDDVRLLVLEGIRRHKPKISEADLKIEFIKQYYKHDLTPEYLEGVFHWIKEKYPAC
jgi:hypothetical protein